MYTYKIMLSTRSSKNLKYIRENRYVVIVIAIEKSFVVDLLIAYIS